MKNLAQCLVLALFVTGTLVSGCELVTEESGSPLFNPASRVVINEVFTLPITNQNVHTWVELYNPTQMSVDMSDWTLSFNSPQARFRALLFKDTVREGGTLILVYTQQFFEFVSVDSIGSVADFPFAGEKGVVLKPNELLTLMNDEDRVKIFTDIGPGPGPVPRTTLFLEGRRDTVKIPLDSTFVTIIRPDTVRWIGYVFYIRPTEQLVLKDASGNVVDIVRFGNYEHPGPGPDPYPNNHSIGMVPEYESIARFAGAYFTGNTANDFYITGGGLRPIPQYYSQAFKR